MERLEEQRTEEFTVSAEGVRPGERNSFAVGTCGASPSGTQGDDHLGTPLTIGVIGAVLLPMWAAISRPAALVTNRTVVVERAQGSG